MTNQPASGKTLRRRHRKLRRCGEFERGKCAHCQEPAGDDHECDMKKRKPVPPNDPGSGE